MPGCAGSLHKVALSGLRCCSFLTSICRFCGFRCFFGRALRLGEIDVQLSDLYQPCLCARVAGAARLRPWTMSCGTLGSHGEF